MVELFPGDFIRADNRGEARISRELVAGTALAGGGAGATTTIFWRRTNDGCKLAKIRANSG